MIQIDSKQTNYKSIIETSAIYEVVSMKVHININFKVKYNYIC